MIPRRQPRPSPPNRTIAIVEDDAAVLNALGFALETEGFAVQAFGTAAAADAGLAMAACLIIDQNLPDETGLNLLKRLRARGVEAPAVIITTNPTVAVRIQAASLRAPIIEKPLLDDQLFAHIRALLP